MEHDERHRVQIEIPARTVVKVVLLIIVAYAAVRLLGQMRNVLVLLGVSLFLALMLMPLVRVVERRMRYSLAVLTVWLGVVLGVLLFLGLLIAPLATQVDDLVAAAPGYIDDPRGLARLARAGWKRCVCRHSSSSSPGSYPGPAPDSVPMVTQI